MKYAIGVIAIVVVIFVALVLLVTSSGNGSGSTQKATTTKLVDYDKSSSSVSFTTQGEIVGDEDYREIKITVTQSRRVLQILKGYNENVIKSKTYYNNQKAYQVFLAALDQAGFRSERKTSISDLRGACPAGNRFIYQLTDNSKDVVNTWSDSCTTREGTFAGGNGSVQQLFQAQIHNYDDITSNVQI